MVDLAAGVGGSHLGLVDTCAVLTLVVSNGTAVHIEGGVGAGVDACAVAGTLVVHDLAATEGKYALLGLAQHACAVVGSVLRDLAAGHGQGGIIDDAGLFVLGAGRADSAAVLLGRVAGDSNAAEGYIGAGYIHAACVGFGCGVAGDGAAGQGTLTSEEVDAAATAGAVAGDGAAGHVEGAAGADVQTAAGSLGGVVIDSAALQGQLRLALHDGTAAVGRLVIVDLSPFDGDLGPIAGHIQTAAVALGGIVGDLGAVNGNGGGIGRFHIVCGDGGTGCGDTAAVAAGSIFADDQALAQCGFTALDEDTAAALGALIFLDEAALEVRLSPEQEDAAGADTGSIAGNIDILDGCLGPCAAEDQAAAAGLGGVVHQDRAANSQMGAVGGVPGLDIGSHDACAVFAGFVAGDGEDTQLRNGAGQIHTAAVLPGCIFADGAAGDSQTGPQTVDTTAAAGFVLSDGATPDVQNAVDAGVDGAAVIGGLVMAEGTVLQGQCRRSLQQDTAAVDGAVAADGAALHSQGAVLAGEVEAAAIAGGPVILDDGAVHQNAGVGAADGAGVLAGLVIPDGDLAQLDDGEVRAVDGAAAGSSLVVTDGTAVKLNAAILKVRAAGTGADGCGSGGSIAADLTAVHLEDAAGFCGIATLDVNGAAGGFGSLVAGDDAVVELEGAAPAEVHKAAEGVAAAGEGACGVIAQQVFMGGTVADSQQAAVVDGKDAALGLLHSMAVETQVQVLGDLRHTGQGHIGCQVVIAGGGQDTVLLQLGKADLLVTAVALTAVEAVDMVVCLGQPVQHQPVFGNGHLIDAIVAEAVAGGINALSQLGGEVEIAVVNPGLGQAHADLCTLRQAVEGGSLGCTGQQVQVGPLIVGDPGGTRQQQCCSVAAQGHSAVLFGVAAGDGHILQSNRTIAAAHIDGTGIGSAVAGEGDILQSDRGILIDPEGAALLGGSVIGDGAAGDGQGGVIVDIDSAAFSTGVAGDGTAVHIQDAAPGTGSTGLQEHGAAGVGGPGAGQGSGVQVKGGTLVNIDDAAHACQVVTALELAGAGAVGDSQGAGRQGDEAGCRLALGDGMAVEAQDDVLADGPGTVQGHIGGQAVDTGLGGQTVGGGPVLEAQHLMVAGFAAPDTVLMLGGKRYLAVNELDEIILIFAGKVTGGVTLHCRSDGQVSPVCRNGQADLRPLGQGRFCQLVVAGQVQVHGGAVGLVVAGDLHSTLQGQGAVGLGDGAHIGNGVTGDSGTVQGYMAGTAHVDSRALGGSVAGDGHSTDGGGAVGSHTEGAALISGGIIGDPAALDIQGGIGIDIHSAALGCLVAGDGTAVHIQDAAGGISSTALQQHGTAAGGGHTACEGTGIQVHGAALKDIDDAAVADGLAALELAVAGAVGQVQGTLYIGDPGGRLGLGHGMARKAQGDLPFHGPRICQGHIGSQIVGAGLGGQAVGGRPLLEGHGGMVTGGAVFHTVDVVLGQGQLALNQLHRVIGIVAEEIAGGVPLHRAGEGQVFPARCQRDADPGALGQRQVCQCIVAGQVQVHGGTVGLVVVGDLHSPLQVQAAVGLGDGTHVSDGVTGDGGVLQCHIAGAAHIDDRALGRGVAGQSGRANGGLAVGRHTDGAALGGSGVIDDAAALDIQYSIGIDIHSAALIGSIAGDGTAVQIQGTAYSAVICALQQYSTAAGGSHTACEGTAIQVQDAALVNKGNAAVGYTIAAALELAGTGAVRQGGSPCHIDDAVAFGTLPHSMAVQAQHHTVRGFPVPVEGHIIGQEVVAGLSGQAGLGSPLGIFLLFMVTVLAARHTVDVGLFQHQLTAGDADTVAGCQAGKPVSGIADDLIAEDHFGSVSIHGDTHRGLLRQYIHRIQLIVAGDVQVLDLGAALQEYAAAEQLHGRHADVLEGCIGFGCHSPLDSALAAAAGQDHKEILPRLHSRSILGTGNGVAVETQGQGTGDGVGLLQRHIMDQIVVTLNRQAVHLVPGGQSLDIAVMGSSRCQGQPGPVSCHGVGTVIADAVRQRVRALGNIGGKIQGIGIQTGLQQGDTHLGTGGKAVHIHNAAVVLQVQVVGVAGSGGVTGPVAIDHSSTGQGQHCTGITQVHGAVAGSAGDHVVLNDRIGQGHLGGAGDLKGRAVHRPVIGKGTAGKGGCGAGSQTDSTLTCSTPVSGEGSAGGSDCIVGHGDQGAAVTGSLIVLDPGPRQSSGGLFAQIDTAALLGLIAGQGSTGHCDLGPVDAVKGTATGGDPVIGDGTAVNVGLGSQGCGGTAVAVDRAAIGGLVAGDSTAVHIEHAAGTVGIAHGQDNGAALIGGHIARQVAGVQVEGTVPAHIHRAAQILGAAGENTAPEGIIGADGGKGLCQDIGIPVPIAVAGDPGGAVGDVQNAAVNIVNTVGGGLLHGMAVQAQGHCAGGDGLGGRNCHIGGQVVVTGSVGQLRSAVPGSPYQSLILTAFAGMAVALLCRGHRFRSLQRGLGRLLQNDRLLRHRFRCLRIQIFFCHNACGQHGHDQRQHQGKGYDSFFHIRFPPVQ